MHYLAKNFLLFLFALTAGVLVTGASAEPAATSDSNTPKRRIVFLGDSLTEGFGVESRYSYPSRIQNRVEQSDLPFKVTNAGVSGDTSAGGLRRIHWLLRSDVDVLVLALGANDGLRGLSVAATEANLIKTVETVRGKFPKVKIVIAGMLVPPNMGDEYAAAFKAIFPKVAKATDAALIPFLLKRVAAEPELNLPDGIHPNEDGYAIVAETVWQSLEPILKEIVLEG